MLSDGRRLPSREGEEVIANTKVEELVQILMTQTRLGIIKPDTIYTAMALSYAVGKCDGAIEALQKTKEDTNADV